MPQQGPRAGGFIWQGNPRGWHVFPDPLDRLMTVLIFFGVAEDAAVTGATTFGDRDGAGGAMEGGGPIAAVAIGATAGPRALGGEALALGEIGAVFGDSYCQLENVRRTLRSQHLLSKFGSNRSAGYRLHSGSRQVRRFRQSRPLEYRRRRGHRTRQARTSLAPCSAKIDR
jgi:hypothetical protein